MSLRRLSNVSLCCSRDVLRTLAGVGVTCMVDERKNFKWLCLPFGTFARPVQSGLASAHKLIFLPEPVSKFQGSIGQLTCNLWVKEATF